MGPDRTKPSRRHGNAEAGPSRSTLPDGRKKPLPIEKRDPGGIPGVSKLKASIRQTKRFLAKDTLEPALRISTERRLVSLEADLASAQRREVEKKNGAKYHQVKFFEKRKLLRIIKRVKRALEDDELDSKGKKKLEKELEEGRAMLNYVRHYPNTQKYIALFPSNSEDDESPTLKLPKLFKKSKSTSAPAEEDESTIKRREVLDRIKGLMETGSLPSEPELVVGADKPSVGQVNLASTTGGGKEGKVKAKKEEEDDFFDVDEE